jgi:hypothetical protein
LTGNADAERRTSGLRLRKPGKRIGAGGVLHNSGVVGKASFEGGLRFGRLADSDVFDVRASEDDVLVDFIARGNRSVSRAVLGAERANFSKRDRRFFGIDRVENSFIANLRFRDQGDLRAEVGDPGGHGERLGLN